MHLVVTALRGFAGELAADGVTLDHRVADSFAAGLAAHHAELSPEVEAHGWTHHIARLVVLGNLALTVGIDPQAVTAWMHERFVDGADWVMVPNVVGMACYADGIASRAAEVRADLLGPALLQ